MINYKIFQKVIKILDDVFLEEFGLKIGLDFEMVIFIGDFLMVILIIDSSIGIIEEMFINVIVGIDLGGL